MDVPLELTDIEVQKGLRDIQESPQRSTERLTLWTFML